MDLFKKTKNYFNFAKNISLSTYDRLKHPYKLTFAITNKCNLRCRTCFIWKKKSVNELTYNEIDKFFTINNFFNWIDITGGEIFMRNDLLDITKSIKRNTENLIMLHYPTNGFMTDKIVSVTEQITSLDFHKLVITVSIDGNEELHNKIRNNKNAFQNAIETYKQLRKNKHLKVYVGCTLSQFNLDYFDKFYNDLREYIPDLKYSDIHVNVYHYSETLYSNEKLGFDKTKCVHTINDFIKKKGFLFINPIVLLEYIYLKNVEKYLSTERIPFRCRASKISCFIDQRGNVYPCTSYNVVLGNLRENDYNLMKILSTDDVLRLFKQIKSGKCPHCWTPCEAYQNVLSNFFMRRKSNE